MKVGTAVLNKETGIKGHVIIDSFRCCLDKEELVVYENTNCGLGTNRNLLEVITEEPHIPDIEKCGAGKGEECCIFITVSGKGFMCERFSELRDSLIFKTMNAKRDPIEPYPECMKF